MTYFQNTLKVLRKHIDSKLPYSCSINDAGYDLFSIEETVIEPNKRIKVRTGISLTIPTMSYGRIAPRSSLAVKYIDVCAGVVDCNYTGEIIVVLHNAGDTPYTVYRGDKIAQLIIERIYKPMVVETYVLDETKRGDNGFGSSGR
jgi:dUTP pyrophosphatase